MNSNFHIRLAQAHPARISTTRFVSDQGVADEADEHEIELLEAEEDSTEVS